MKAPEKEIRQIKCEGEDSVERLSVGEDVYYAFSRHGSVGEDAEFEIENDEVLLKMTKSYHTRELKLNTFTLKR
ncbi:MAG: hypothetical protein ACXAB0_08855 [Candidatus Thorarchaeota archaeon]|jgi:hypothetical protein